MAANPQDFNTLTYDPAKIGYSVVKEAPPISRNHKSGHVYTSAEVYENEKQKIFYHDWLIVGRVEEVEKPGDYITLRVADEPVLVTRNKQNQIVALANVCAHRGTQVAFGDGHTKYFTCPYHGWIYDLDGQLINAQHLEKATNFDLEKCRLPRLELDTWGGFIFVTFNQNPQPLLEALGEVPNIYAPYQPERLRMAAKFPGYLDCNWKLLNENLTDIYHIAVLHTATFGPHQPLEGYRFAIRDGGYDGRFLGGTLVPGGKSLFGPMPWLPPALHSGGYSSHIPPNCAFFPRFDFLAFSTNWPVAVDKCVGWHYMLFPEDHFEQPDFMEKAQQYADFYKAFLDEDIEMVASLQKGLNSRFYGKGPMSPFEEGVAQTIKHNIEDIGSA